MPLLQITADRDEMRLHGAHGPLRPGLTRALDRTTGPVTILIHGFKYQPGHGRHCPYLGIFSDSDSTAGRLLSWPRLLGLQDQIAPGGTKGHNTATNTEPDLGLGFGWNARGSIWRAWRTAWIAGQRLAALIDDIRQVAPHRPINILAHSLGARVALTAMESLSPGRIDSAILLAGAAYGAQLDAARRAGGRDTAILNVTSRENDLFDFLLERLVAPPRPGDRALGQLSGDNTMRPGSLTRLQLDDAASLSALARAGFPVAPRNGTSATGRSIHAPASSRSTARCCLGRSASRHCRRFSHRTPRRAEHARPRTGRSPRQRRKCDRPLSPRGGTAWAGSPPNRPPPIPIPPRLGQS